MSEKSLYSRTAYKDVLDGTVSFINERNETLKGYKQLTLLELVKALVDHKPKKLIPTSLYDEVNGKGTNAIIPKELCNAMLKNKPDIRCSRKIKKPGDEFCFHHIKVLNEGGSIRTWDEYQTMKNKTYRGKRLKLKSKDKNDGDIVSDVDVDLVYDTD
jgi:hypothetical protein